MFPSWTNWWGKQTYWLSLADSLTDYTEHITPAPAPQTLSSAFLHTGSYRPWTLFYPSWDATHRTYCDVISYDVVGCQLRSSLISGRQTNRADDNYLHSNYSDDCLGVRGHKQDIAGFHTATDDVTCKNADVLGLHKNADIIMGNSCMSSAAPSKWWGTKWRIPASQTRSRPKGSPVRERTRLYEMHKTGEEWMETFLGACGRDDPGDVRVEKVHCTPSGQSHSPKSRPPTHPESLPAMKSEGKGHKTKKVKKHNSWRNKKKKNENKDKFRYSYVNQGADMNEETTQKEMQTETADVEQNTNSKSNDDILSKTESLDKNVDLGSKIGDINESHVHCLSADNTTQPPAQLSTYSKEQLLKVSDSSEDLDRTPLTLSDLCSSTEYLEKSGAKLSQKDSRSPYMNVEHEQKQEIGANPARVPSCTEQVVPARSAGHITDEQIETAHCSNNEPMGLTQDMAPLQTKGLCEQMRPAQDESHCNSEQIGTAHSEPPELLHDLGKLGQQDLSSPSSEWSSISSSSCSLLSLESLIYPTPITYRSDPIEHKLYGALPSSTTSRFTSTTRSIWGRINSTSQYTSSQASTYEAQRISSRETSQDPSQIWSDMNIDHCIDYKLNRIDREFPDNSFPVRPISTCNNHFVSSRESSQTSHVLEERYAFDSDHSFEYRLGTNNRKYACDYGQVQNSSRHSCGYRVDNNSTKYSYDHGLGMKRHDMCSKENATESYRGYGGGDFKQAKNNREYSSHFQHDRHSGYTGERSFYVKPHNPDNVNPKTVTIDGKQTEVGNAMTCKDKDFAVTNSKEKKPVMLHMNLTDDDSSSDRLHNSENLLIQGLDHEPNFLQPKCLTSHHNAYSPKSTDLSEYNQTELKILNNGSTGESNQKGDFKFTSTPEYTLSSSSSSLDSLSSSLEDLTLDLDSSRSMDDVGACWRDVELWEGSGGSGEEERLSPDGLRRFESGEAEGFWEGRNVNPFCTDLTFDLLSNPDSNHALSPHSSIGWGNSPY